MFELIAEVGGSVFSNVLQLAAGCVPAAIIYRIFNGKYQGFKKNTPFCILLIAIFSALGLLLPLGTYGTIPLAFALLAIGLRHVYILPLIFSNAMFNMLVSYTDISFSWKTGTGRVLLAFTAGFVSGLVFKLIKNEDIIRMETPSLEDNSRSSFARVIGFFSENINAFGLFLIIGAVLNALFHKYLLESVVNFIFLNPLLTNSLKYFLWFDVANPYFQYIFNLFFNLTALAAFIRFLKLRGLLVFVFTYSFLALLFSVVAYL